MVQVCTNLQSRRLVQDLRLVQILYQPPRLVVGTNLVPMDRSPTFFYSNSHFQSLPLAPSLVPCSAHSPSFQVPSSLPSHSLPIPFPFPFPSPACTLTFTFPSYTHCLSLSLCSLTPFPFPSSLAPFPIPFSSLLPPTRPPYHTNHTT